MNVKCLNLLRQATMKSTLYYTQYLVVILEYDFELFTVCLTGIYSDSFYWLHCYSSKRIQQPYHPVAQDWSPTEAKQG